MKKIILGIVGLVLTVTLAACGTNTNTATINSLAVQLDETSNTVSSVQSVSPMEISVGASTSEKINSNASFAQQSLYGEENYKREILARTAILKNCMKKDLNLSKAQATAVKDLTNSLNKYTNSIAYTKNELSSTVKSISSLSKHPEKNSDKLNAKLNRLACNSNMRASYYSNILNILDELEDYLCCENCPQTEDKTILTNQNEDDSQQNSDEQENNYPISQPRTFERMPYAPTTYPQYRNRGYYPYNNSMFGGFYGNGYGAFNNGFYNNAMYGNRFIGMNGGFGEMPYSYDLRFYRFNPYRNTDTYAPILSNIDTYRQPTGQSEYVTPVDSPEERLESFEKESNENLDENFMVDTDEDATSKQESLNILIIGDSTKTFDELKEQILQERSSNGTEMSVSVMARKNDKHIVAH